MSKISELTPEQVLQLRSEVTLNSLYTSDYSNRLGVDPGEACSFFDGYCEYLGELMAESDPNYDDSMFAERLGEYDTELNLREWFKGWLG